MCLLCPSPETSFQLFFGNFDTLQRKGKPQPGETKGSHRMDFDGCGPRRPTFCLRSQDSGNTSRPSLLQWLKPKNKANCWFPRRPYTTPAQIRGVPGRPHTPAKRLIFSESPDVCLPSRPAQDYLPRRNGIRHNLCAAYVGSTEISAPHFGVWPPREASRSLPQGRCHCQSAPEAHLPATSHV